MSARLMGVYGCVYGCEAAGSRVCSNRELREEGCEMGGNWLESDKKWLDLDKIWLEFG